MLCVAEVKCYQCSRICGEVEGLHPQDFDLRRVQVDLSTYRCDLESVWPLRCGRCGGNLYLDDVECVYGSETTLRN